MLLASLVAAIGTAALSSEVETALPPAVTAPVVVTVPSLLTVSNPSEITAAVSLPLESVASLGLAVLVVLALL
jgi:hypothetical protein